ncbi:MAG: YggS family pyridoxal phosphate-dependent enzyme [Ferruginibacter sp.]
MAFITDNYQRISTRLKAAHVELVAVSKIRTEAEILQAYNEGIKDFGENYVQEIVSKVEALPKDIRWHFIGHLQSNKLKFIAPFIYMIQGVDSFKLLKEINKEGEKNNRVINCLLQIHIAGEETKFGLDEDELDDIIGNAELKSLRNIKICGLMGMASFSDDEETVINEFSYLKSLFNSYSHLSTNNCQLTTLSMGMSGDYELAIKEGSNMVRIGSLLFGNRPVKI